MFDDLNYIKQIDKSGMLDIIGRYPQHIMHAAEISSNITIPDKISKVVVAGMGGSGIGGDILAAWAYDRVDIPIFVSRDYKLPRFADKDTLVFSVSYSGNTEETLSSTADALSRGCKVVSVTSGGKLEALSKLKDIQIVKVPPSMPPRTAVCYLTIPLISVLRNICVFADNEIQDTINTIQDLLHEIGPSVPTSKNVAKYISCQIKGLFPIIYGHGYYIPIARRWRTQLNENAKILARDDSFPEANHNDLMGWNSDTRTSSTAVVLLRDATEDVRIRRRIEVSKKLAFCNANKVVEVWSKGNTVLSKMFYSMLVGDFTSIYLALLMEVDPTPVDVIEKFKLDLAW